MAAKAARRRPALPVLPRPEQLRELYAELLALPNVEGCYVGFKRREGRTVREVSVVACVSEKLGTRKLSRSDRIPRKLGWRATSRRTRTIPTDVQVIGESTLHAAVLGAGDGVDRITQGGTGHNVAGTVGAAMLHPRFGKVVTTAGHVLGLRKVGAITYEPGAEPRVTLRNGGSGAVVQGIARRASITPDADYALITPPDDMPAENLYQDEQPLALPNAPGPDDLNMPVFVLTRRKMLDARLLGIHGMLSLGGLVLHDLLLTRACTNSGDSGACLVDSGSRLLGFVEGLTRIHGKPVTVYTSAAWPFIHEDGVFF